MPLLADPVTVLPEQREALEQLVRSHSTPQQLAMRARLILCAADGVGVRESGEDEEERCDDEQQRLDPEVDVHEAPFPGDIRGIRAARR